MTNPLSPSDYGALRGDIKQRIRAGQYAALRAVNTQLIALYWDIGALIVHRQQGQTWGRAVVETLARDLQTEFPGAERPRLAPLAGQTAAETYRREGRSLERC